jgi:PTS system mannose-specific IIA component
MFMIGLVVVTHGQLAREFVAAMEHVVGTQPNTCSICIGADDDMDQRRNDIAEAVRATDQGEGVLILTDMFGGTPSNLALSLLDKDKVEVLAGVNLPMLIKVAEARQCASLGEVAAQGLDAGARYIALGSVIANAQS